jgi:hypothetical protein
MQLHVSLSESNYKYVRNAKLLFVSECFVFIARILKLRFEDKFYLSIRIFCLYCPYFVIKFRGQILFEVLK